MDKMVCPHCGATIERAPQKPIPLKDIPDHPIVWLEIHPLQELIPAILCAVQDDKAIYTMGNGYVFTFSANEYGCTWHAWENVPTEEERSDLAWG